MGKHWWQEAVVYEVYPRSFNDSNHDGIGDINGITEKLDYIKSLGATAIWVCPCYRSPWADYGYDIADYYQVAPEFGTNEDLYRLIAEAKKRGIRILMDLVLNHTSDEHSWFQEALHDSNSPYRDYYYFRKGRNGNPPNNWRSYFGGSAWEVVPNEPNMYYLHAFDRKMPDLNWESSEMRQELYRMINWWVDKGVGGFRIDAILNIKKNLVLGELPSDGEDGLVAIDKYIINQPGIGKFLGELRDEAFVKHDIMTIAEAAVPDSQVKEFIGPNGYFNMSFDFRAADIDIPASGEWYKPTDWTMNQLRDVLMDAQLAVQRSGWGAVYLENHDQNRSINKYFAAGSINDNTKKMLATILLGFRGTPVIFQGEEIGMENIQLHSLDDYHDVATHNQYALGKAAGVDEESLFKYVTHRSRDNSRTPMQWSQQENAGFTTATPWLPVNPNYKQINVDSENNQTDSVLNFYRRLIRLRHTAPYQALLIYGRVDAIRLKDNLMGYTRRLGDKRIVVLANMQGISQKLNGWYTNQNVIANSQDDLEHEGNTLVLHPYQAVMLYDELEEELS